MTITRRQLLASAAFALPAARALAFIPERPSGRAVADAALQAAKAGGATYADVRLVRHRRQFLRTRDDHLIALTDADSYGVGVRVLKGGTWGFTGTPEVSPRGAQAAARRALLIAQANASLPHHAVRLAPEPAYVDSWQTPIEKDPFRISLDTKVRLLTDSAQAAKGAVPAVKLVRGTLAAVLEEKRFFSSEGSDIEQMIYRVSGGYIVTVTKTGDFETRRYEVAPASAGFEHIEWAALPDAAPGIAKEALEKLNADRPAVGPRDLVLHPSHLWLTIHESIGHSTELDRALGYEANLAGTSFATPGQIGRLRYGGPLANFYADRTTPGGLATCAYDDDGVATTRFDLIRQGVLVAFQTSRDQIDWPGFSGERSRGCAYADSWASPPFQRMPNVSLAPGRETLSLEQLIARTDSGIYIQGDGSYSIDQQRKNFQFGGDFFWEIKNGKLTRPLRKVAYQSTSLEFWKAMDAVCDSREWRLYGAMSDGKGEPMQLNPVSHGCAPARFRGVRVLDASEGAA